MRLPWSVTRFTTRGPSAPAGIYASLSPRGHSLGSSVVVSLHLPKDMEQYETVFLRLGPFTVGQALHLPEQAGV